MKLRGVEMSLVGTGRALLGALNLLIPLAASALSPDDFNSCSLDSSNWMFVDPRGNSSATLVGAGSGDAKLRISVPAGSDHDAAGTNNTARLMQATGNVDFDVAVKFDSPVTQKFQMQGLMAEAGAGSWVRFDVYNTGSKTKLYLASSVGGVETVRLNQVISTPSYPMHLRLRRAGDAWSSFRSSDGQTWQPVASFTHAAIVTHVGVFAGNAGPDPAHTAEIDYFYDPAQPIAGEDEGSVAADNELLVSVSGNGSVSVDPEQAQYSCGQSVTLVAEPAESWSFTGWSGDLSGNLNPALLPMDADRSVTAIFSELSGPPALLDIQATNVSTSAATITWTTDQPSTSRVEYGTTLGYELGSVEQSALVTQHAVALSSLAAGSLHHYRVTSANAQSNVSTSGDRSFTTQSAGGPSAPVIDVWYGNTQRFGDIGVPQPHVNVLGNASDPQGVSSLSYRLNGGPTVALSMGPDGRRLADPGDFNIDIPIDALVDGTNAVAISAVDGNGFTATQNVTLIFDSTRVWPSSYSIDWSQVSSVNDVAQVLDGQWELSGGALRTAQVDYDRLVAIGDMEWGDYEVVAPITIHAIDGSVSQNSGTPGVGLLVRWQRHLPPGQPERNYDFGGFGMYRLGAPGKPNKLVSYTLDSVSTPAAKRTLSLDVPYIFKIRVERSASANQYRFKVWPQGAPEPPGWDTIEDQPPGEAVRGSLLLVAHHMDVSFGNVTVTPLP